MRIANIKRYWCHAAPCARRSHTGARSRHLTHRMSNRDAPASLLNHPLRILPPHIQRKQRTFTKQAAALQAAILPPLSSFPLAVALQHAFVCTHNQTETHTYYNTPTPPSCSYTTAPSELRPGPAQLPRPDEALVIARGT